MLFRSVLAQRLVRRLCASCHGSGCAACHHSGHQGRTGIFELMLASPTLREGIHQGATEAQLRACACTDGMVLMRHDGQRLVDQGLISAAELMRATRD